MAPNETTATQKEKLVLLTDSLLQNPPRTLSELQERYQEILDIIEVLEAGNTTRWSRVLSTLNGDFSPVQRLYPYCSEGFLNKPASVLAHYYRFFVGGIESYIKTL